jgi:hypothetical protein
MSISKGIIPNKNSKPWILPTKIMTFEMKKFKQILENKDDYNFL